MITLTKIDGTEITVNCDEIEFVESSHDSVIGLKSGRKIIVKETAKEIVERVIDFRRRCLSGARDIKIIENQNDDA